MKNNLKLILEFAPLSVFLILQRLGFVPYYVQFGVATTLVIMSLFVLIRSRYCMSRLNLGINIYLIFGFLLLSLNYCTENETIRIMNQITEEIRSIGMYFSIIIVAVFTQFFTTSQFIGIPTYTQSKTIKSSLLFISTIIALCLTCFFKYQIQAHEIIVEVLPFVLLFVIQSKLRRIE